MPSCVPPSRTRPDEFAHLERAHVLGQASTREHVRVHWRMLQLGMAAIAMRASSFGQVFRIAGRGDQDLHRPRARGQHRRRERESGAAHAARSRTRGDHRESARDAIAR